MQPYRVFCEASIRISYLEAAVAVPGQLNDGIEVALRPSRALKTSEQSRVRNGILDAIRGGPPTQVGLSGNPGRCHRRVDQEREFWLRAGSSAGI